MIRTRFAPSPSGFLHVGGARTALFNYLYAKAKGGQFIIRVEDTDQERSTPESEKTILESLRWLGILSDEGPIEGGPYGPYRQSERLETYAKYTEKLIKEKKAYRCFCKDEELEKKQEQARTMGLPYVYDGKCKALSNEEIDSKLKSKESFAIRFQVDPSEIVVEDLVQGRVKFDSRLIGDFIIVKSDGFPSYNYAVVVDDHEMKISHVIRGVGHLSNTPRQILIHEALGIDLPKYAHISEIVGTDKKKLSKRRGATSVLFFKELGYLPEAFVNYMSLLGWYPEDGTEFMPENELEHKFDVERCSKSPAMFDFFQTDKSSEADVNVAALTLGEIKALVNPKTKLNWLNNKYIRHYPTEKTWELALDFIKKDSELNGMLSKDEKKLKAIYENTKTYLNTIDECVGYIREIARVAVETDADAKTILAETGAKETALSFATLVESANPITPEDFSAAIKATGEKTGSKGKNLFMPIRAASTGQTHGLELPILFSLLGAKTVAERIHKTIG